MLVSLSLENWMSFRDEVTFSMVASRQRLHGERIARIPKYPTRILPIATLYGGNASGKSNFFGALHFAKALVVKGTQLGNRIPVHPFALDPKTIKKPSKFCFEILVDETIYEFSFLVTDRLIEEEKLTRISSGREIVLYHRKGGELNFDKSLADDKFLEFAFQGTRDNQLFLTNSVSQKVTHFEPVYDWFSRKLVLIEPDTRFAESGLFFDKSSPLRSPMSELLSKLDTGIECLDSKEIPFQNVQLPDPVKADIEKEIEEDAVIFVQIGSINERYEFTLRDGNLIAKKLVANHKMTDGNNVKFELYQESDGSQRLIDLLPAFIELSRTDSGRVFAIDELDRSLHTLLTQTLLQEYLSRCNSDTRSQLLMTTHDALLMDQRLLRRDEMWVAERGVDGVSKLYSFSDYRGIRYDKDIRKSYLQGRFGGVPRIDLSTIGTNADFEMSIKENG